MPTALQRPPRLWDLLSYSLEARTHGTDRPQQTTHADEYATLTPQEASLRRNHRTNYFLEVSNCTAHPCLQRGEEKKKEKGLPLHVVKHSRGIQTCWQHVVRGPTGDTPGIQSCWQHVVRGPTGDNRRNKSACSSLVSPFNGRERWLWYCLRQANRHGWRLCFSFSIVIIQIKVGEEVY